MSSYRTFKITTTIATAVLAFAGLQLGCADYAMGNGMGAGDVGVTPGGSQDIQLAREIIAQGGIPAAEHFTAEGLFSEHDLPLDGDECDQILCPRAATSLTQPLGMAVDQYVVQLGFGTNIQSDFERRALNLAVSVDVSGSMSGEMASVKDALQLLVDQLDDGDQMALTVFGEQAHVVHGMTTMDAAGRDQMRDAIDGLDIEGSTNLEDGLLVAFGEAAPMAGMQGVEDRVMIFTDVQPNTGATDMNSFIGITRYYAAAGIGLTMFGVGMDLGSELAEAMSNVRGGNYFFLANEEVVDQVFVEEFDYVVSPIGYDLNVEITAETGLLFDAAYGAPLDQPASPNVDFGASTLFLSARHGGIGVTLAADPTMEIELDEPQLLAMFELSYLPVDGNNVITDEVEVHWLGGRDIEGAQTNADDLGVYKMAVLLDEYLALMAAAHYCEGSLTQVEASDLITEASARLDGVATHLVDVPLAEEKTLMDNLQLNVQGGVGNCWEEDAYIY